MSEKNILQKVSDLGKSMPAETWGTSEETFMVGSSGAAAAEFEINRLRQQLSEARGKIEELEEKLQQIDDIAKLTLTRGDYQYGLGQIMGIAASALKGTEDA